MRKEVTEVGKGDAGQRRGVGELFEEEVEENIRRRGLLYQSSFTSAPPAERIIWMANPGGDHARKKKGEMRSA